MKFFVLTLFLVSFYSCHAQFYRYPNYYYPGPRQVSQPRAPTYQTNIGYRNSNAVQKPLDVFRDMLSRGTMQLTLYIDRHLKTATPNVVFSPLSLQMLLANILLASKGQTFNEIAQIFNINSNSEKNFHENFGKLIEQTFNDRSGIGGPEVDYGTGVFLTNDLPVSKTFESESKRFYKTLVRGVNYRNGEAQNIINDWVKSTTHGLIDTIVDQPPKYDTKAIIASALYFKGKWANRFDFNKGYFEATSGPYADNFKRKWIHMISTKGEYPYYKDENLGLEIISLPYKDSQVSMYVVIPKEVLNLRHMKNSLTPDIIDKLIKNMESTDMIFLLPKVNLSHELDFTQVLNDMGVKSLTDSQRADLSRLTSRNIYNSRIYFDKIIQKVKMSITEEGTEAAAVSAGIGFRFAREDPIRVSADRPFLFFIRDNETKSVLFYGSIYDPEL